MPNIDGEVQLKMKKAVMVNIKCPEHGLFLYVQAQ